MTRPDVVQVWLISTELPDVVLADVASLLDEEERSRAAAMARAAHRRRFLAVHGAVRVIVGRHLGTRPERLMWRYGPHGKPSLAIPGADLEVSMSHSGQVAALALSDSRPVGVDVQVLADSVDVLRMSRRFYPPLEAGFVSAATDHDDQVRRFTWLWARKEACVKVHGGRLLPGLRLPVTGIGCVVAADPGGPLPGPYAIQNISAPRGYYAAVALEGIAEFQVRTYRWPASCSAGF